MKRMINPKMKLLQYVEDFKIVDWETVARECIAQMTSDDVNEVLIALDLDDESMEPFEL